jgi:D-3-phosphoglycerate dehydrogenase / 2-oxoglutarate reductase
MPRVMCTSLNAKDGPHRRILAENGCELIDAPRHLNLFDEDILIALMADCEAVLAGSEPYTRRVIESLPRLRAICRTGVGYDAIDLAACDDAGVVVTITPGVNHHSVAEHTIALLMGVARGFPELDRKVRENRWDRQARPRVMGATLGIVGLGRIGQAVATRAVGLGLKVLAQEPFPNQEFVDRWNIELVSLDDLLARSDYVSLHCPAARECRHLINARTLARMKPGSVLINTARGSIVDEAALYDALKSGHLRGAGLDVFEVEPLPLSSPLLTLDNVLLAGHVAGLDRESHRDTFAMVAETVVDLYNGRWPAECVVNLKGRTGWSWNGARRAASA